MLSRTFRLRKNEIERVFKKGRGFRGNVLNIKSILNNLDHPRFAIVCPNKVAPKAVTRNRLRRKTYAILGEIASTKNLDVVINYHHLPDEVQIKPILLDIFQKSGIIEINPK